MTRTFRRRAWLAALALAAALALPAAADDDGGDAPWIEVRSPHFTLITDAGVERGAEVVLGLERFRALFARLAPEVELASPAPTRIVAFRDTRSFDPYKTAPDRAGARVLGQFLSSADGNFITLDADPRRQESLAVVYHELTHYLVRHNLPTAPRWLDEGLAEYYGAFSEDGERAYVGRPVERHLDRLRGAEIDLEALLVAGETDFHPDRGQGAARLYAEAWALTHYLLSGPPQRLDAVAGYLGRLAAGEPSAQAFEEAFGERRRRLEERLGAYLAAGDFPLLAVDLAELPLPAAVEVAELPTADRLALLGDLLAWSDRAGGAADHYRAALARDPRHPAALSGLAALAERRGDADAALELHRQAIAGGGADALAHLRYGRHLLARLAAAPPGLPAAAAEPRATETRAVLGRAVELQPDYAEARALLARAHLYGEADPAAGLPHVQVARRLSPLRTDLLLTEVELLVRAARFESAAALADGPLARRDPELAARAREEVERGRLLHAAEAAFAAGDADGGLGHLDAAVSATTDPVLRDALAQRLINLQQELGRR